MPEPDLLDRNSPYARDNDLAPDAVTTAGAAAPDAIRGARPSRLGADEAPAARDRPRVRLLDGFRLVAALMVMSWHYAALGHGAAMRPAADVRPLYPVAAYGWLGVELFFLISGFVIALSAVHRTVGQFAVSRFVRLFPAYWLGVLATTTVLLIWPIAVRAPRISDVGVNLTMLQEGFRVPSVDAVYWTLFAELRFYLLFTLVVRRGVTYSRVVTFSAVWLAACALTYSSGGLIHMLVMPDWGPFFIAGLMFFLMHRYGPNLLLWLIVAATFLLGQRQALGSNNFHMLGRPMPSWPVVAILAAFYLLVAAVALGRLRADWRWLTVAGVLTYPLYLLHEYIGWTLFAALRGWAADWVLLAVIVAGMLGLAWLVHRFIERPLAPRLRRALSRCLAGGSDRWRRSRFGARTAGLASPANGRPIGSWQSKGP